jgi:xanthine dehydrogenase YagR molybdenum-binding subunit
MAKTNILGPARDRVDGPLKVQGQAKYAVEFEIPRCAIAWPVESNIASGKITAIDDKAALSIPGVLAVLTHENAPKLKDISGSDEDALCARRSPIIRFPTPGNMSPSLLPRPSSRRVMLLRSLG